MEANIKKFIKFKRIILKYLSIENKNAINIIY